jgi:transcriptional antiterminator RfaH
MSEPAWYLVYSKPQQEERARVNLDRQGYEPFLPMTRVQRRKSGRFVTRIEPMFPRYLFTRVNPEEGWAPIRSTFGVSSLVRFGAQPTPVPDALVDHLRAGADEQGIIGNLVPPDLEAGQRVRIIEGLLEGYEGIIEAKDGQERVRLLLDLVNRHAVATLNAHQVTRVTG